MNRAHKEAVATTVLGLAALVRRAYTLRTPDPVVRIAALPPGMANSTLAFYAVPPPTLHFRPSYLTVDVILHELAHWVQHTQHGVTDCASTPRARRNLRLVREHAAIQQTLADLARRAGYAAILASLVTERRG